MTREKPTTIRVKLLIAIGVDLPTAAILWKEDYFVCQHDWMRIVFVVIDDKANDKDAPVGATWLNYYRLRHHQRHIKRQRFRRGGNNDWIRIVFVVLNEKVNNEYAATGVVTDTVPDERQSNVPCFRRRRFMMRSMRSPGRRGCRTTSSNALKILK